jgi:hypothetical protein
MTSLQPKVGPLRETVTATTPLGIRFWDPVTNRQVTEGLRVSAHTTIGTRRLGEAPGSQPIWPRAWARRTRGGIYAFHTLPGLGHAEPGLPVNAREYWLEVHDTTGRFMPVGFPLEAPRDPPLYTGGASASPPTTQPPGFYLFSAPARPLLSTLAAIRGQLEVEGSDPPAPAAYAVVTVEIEGMPRHRSISDAAGRFVVPFHYPRFDPGVGQSPPTGDPPTPPRQQCWEARLNVQYEPGRLRLAVDSDVPDLRTIRQQAPADLWATPPPAAPQPVLVEQLCFGHELTVRTDSYSTLVIRPAGSPP